MLYLLRIVSTRGCNLRWRRLPRVVFLMSSLSRALNEALDALMEITTVLLRRILLLVLTSGNLLHILRFRWHELLRHLVRGLLLILVLLLDIEVSKGVLHLRLLVHIHESKLKSGQLVRQINQGWDLLLLLRWLGWRLLLAIVDHIRLLVLGLRGMRHVTTCS